MTAPARVMTIGHSTRSEADFVALLAAHGVGGIADVRKIPRSRRHPHFSREPLEKRLPEQGVEYRHFGELGGLRSPRPDSSNTGWRHPAFRAYADHMGTDSFRRAIDELLEFASGRLVAVMCAEAKWWECHRQLVADALVARGVDVRHIMSPTSAPVHTLTSFARVTGTDVIYPGLIC